LLQSIVDVKSQVRKMTAWVGKLETQDCIVYMNWKT
jgi:hypothetical protein